MSNLLEVNWANIPAPVDDGGAAHLTGATVVQIDLPGTNGKPINLAKLQGRVVVYAYPMTGRPDTPLPDGWDLMPGARGCTPQSCAFRDHRQELSDCGVSHIFGLSTQDTEYQREAASRLHLPFALLSDEKLKFAGQMRLPTFEVDGKTLLKRLTMIIDDGQISHVFYPVFPPDQNAQDVLNWLASQTG